MSDGRAVATPFGRRFLGIPWLFAVAYSSVAFSIYYSLGVVADHGLGLTPVVFGIAGLVFVVTTMTYVEGGAMFVERGGSNTLARHAFNELVSFVAGWAILIDYVIVIALAAISVPHYLTPIADELGEGALEVIIAVAVVGFAAFVNVVGFRGERRQGFLLALTAADMLLQLAIIVIGAIAVWDPSALTAELDLFTSPDVSDLLTAIVISVVALAGIEAASDLAPDLIWEKRDLQRVLRAGSFHVPLVYIGMAAVALMAVPVVATPTGPETALGGIYEDAPVLGVAQAIDPGWLGDILKWAVVVIAPLVLLFAAGATMLGLSRHVYVLARNRQVPSWLGKLGQRRATPHVAILIAAAFAAGLVIPGDVELLAGVFAFGATLAIAIAHASLIRLRFSEPELERPYVVPFSIPFRGGSVPLPAALGVVLAVAGLVAVMALHGGALYVGGGWMLFGLVAYAVYRGVVEGIPLTAQVSVPEEALFKEKPDVDVASILVPVFGEGLDDEIVGTAGRLADSGPGPSGRQPRMELLYVMPLPLTIPLDAEPPAERLAEARRALERASEVADEYASVDVASEMVPARSVGEAIVAEARERGVEAIVMGGEPPSKIRGGAILGGVRGSKTAEVGPVTEYVLRHAPCRVLVTAPPAWAFPGGEDPDWERREAERQAALARGGSAAGDDDDGSAPKSE